VSRDADEAQDILIRHLAPHRLVPSAPRQCIHASGGTLQLGSALLVEVGYGAAVDVLPDELAKSYLVHSALAGATQIHVAAARTVLMHPQNVCISSASTQPHYRLMPTSRHLTLRVPRTTLEAHFKRAMGGAPLVRPVIFDSTVADSLNFSRAWRGLIAHVREQAAICPQLMANKRLQQHYLAIALEMLLLSAPHNYTCRLDHDPAEAASSRRIRQACALIEACMAEPLSVASIARRVGVSMRSLQSGFRRSLGTTPLQFIRERRLERLHASLATANEPNANVTQLMLECGIVNFGRFARYYRERFGCRPSDTLKRRRT